MANPDLAKAYDKYIYYFFPADEGDMRARIWMEGRGLRTNLSVNEQIEAVRSQFLIMKKAQINDKYVNGVHLQGGLRRVEEAGRRPVRGCLGVRAEGHRHPRTSSPTSSTGC